MTKSSKIKYKQTKELVRIALNSGMTQDKVGEMCRVKQPQVSKWCRGDARASLQQMQPLIERFGHLLKREPFKLYHYVAEPPNRYIKVEGRVLLRERFLKQQRNSHDELPNAVRITVQIRPNRLFSLAVEVTSADSPNQTQKREPAVAYWNDRFAVWSCTQLQDELHTRNLLAGLDDYVTQKEVSEKFPTTAAIPYLVREALIKHGHQSQDIAERI